MWNVVRCLTPFRSIGTSRLKGTTLAPTVRSCIPAGAVPIINPSYTHHNSVASTPSLYKQWHRNRWSDSHIPSCKPSKRLVSFSVLPSVFLGLASGLFYLVSSSEDDEESSSSDEEGSSSSEVAEEEDEAAKDRAAFEVVGQFNPSLPTYSKQDLQSHKTREGRIWVSFREGVYDITDFVEGHPGGSKILLAAGSAIDPFWNMYQVHKTAATAQLLESYRIGNILRDSSTPTIDESDPYAADPARHPALKVNTQKPFNAETPAAIMGDNFITPNDLFFVRNHLPVPLIGGDGDHFKLEITGDNMDSVFYTLEDLKTLFESHTVVATIQCAGNRRSEMSSAKPVRGLSWGIGAISNAAWRGPKLRDVLIAAGIPQEEVAKTIHHIQFEALDKDFEKFYGASVPVHKVMDPSSDVILAMEMNGEPIPPDHGYPLRVIVPGTVGARNVKWLKKVIASKDESPSHWQEKDYKGFGPYTDWDNLNYNDVPAIQELPVQSAITNPSPNSTVTLDDDELFIKGYAWSGGGRSIVRVDVSMDNGSTWAAAKILPNEQPRDRAWAWTLWEHRFKVPPGVKEADLVVKCVDSAYNVQPERWEPIWNVRGVLSTAWHRVHVNIDREEE